MKEECEVNPYCKCDDCQKEAEDEYPADRN